MDKGAHFNCCDFQVHTPRDRQWEGQPAISEAERLQYAQEFIAAVRTKGLNAVAITDHHDMAFIPYIRRAAAEERDGVGNPVPVENRIVVFPGMELTLAIPCQALLIFDADFPNDLFSLAVNALAITPSAPAEQYCAEVRRLDEVTTFDKLYERDILRPCLHDVTLEAYARPEYNKYMIFPYDLSGKRAVLYQPAEMKKTFPGALSYLQAHKTELEKRSIMGGSEEDRQFYQFGRSQSLKKFTNPKIILPILSREPRYAYDDKNIVVTGGGNGPYYLVRPQATSGLSNFYLLAVLCHPLSEAMVRTRTSVFRGGYYSHGKQFIEVLPIPEPKEGDREVIEKLVENIIDAISEVKTAKTHQASVAKQREVNSLRGRIEGLITKAFGLSEDDLKTICAVPIPE